MDRVRIALWECIMWRFNVGLAFVGDRIIVEDVRVERLQSRVAFLGRTEISGSSFALNHQ